MRMKRRKISWLMKSLRSRRFRKKRENPLHTSPKMISIKLIWLWEWTLNLDLDAIYCATSHFHCLNYPLSQSIILILSFLYTHSLSFSIFSCINFHAGSVGRITPPTRQILASTNTQISEADTRQERRLNLKRKRLWHNQWKGLKSFLRARQWRELSIK